MHRDTLQRIFNVRLSQSAYFKASLPIKMGGMGVRSTTDIAFPCYVSSAFSAERLVLEILPEESRGTFTHILEDLKNEVTSQIGPVSDEDIQKQHIIDEQFLASKMQTRPPQLQGSYEAAVDTAVKHKMCGRWLEAIPCEAVGTMLDNQTFRIATALRLGLPLGEAHTCRRCQTLVSQTGEHGLHCRGNKEIGAPHHSLNHVLARAM